MSYEYLEYRFRVFLDYLHAKPTIDEVANIWFVVIFAIKAAALSLIVSYLYKKNIDEHSSFFRNSPSFFLLIFGMSSIIFLIDRNIMGAFSLIGAISIIRFRAVIKNQIDTSMYFLCLIAGMSIATFTSWIVILYLALLFSFMFFINRLTPTLFTKEKKYRYLVSINHNQIKPSELKSRIDSLFNTNCRFMDSHHDKDFTKSRFTIYLSKQKNELNKEISQIQQIPGIKNLCIL